MRKAFFVAAVLSLFALGACSPQAPMEGPEQAMPETPVAPIPVTNVTEAENPGQNSNAFTFDSALFQGKLTGCSYAQAGKLLVSAEELYLYDTVSGAVLSQCPVPLQDFEAAPFEDGVALTAMSDTGMVVRIYDNRMNLKESIDLEKLLPDDYVVGPNCVSVSSDGDRLAIAGLDALYLYDRPTERLTMLLDIARGTGGAGINTASLNGVAFTPDDNRVAFSGDGFPEQSGEGGESAPMWGTIGIYGSGLELEWLDAEGVEETLRADGKLFFPPAISHVDGGLSWVDTASGDAHRIAFSANDEGGDGIYVSEQGKYVATAELGSAVTVRIYAVDSGDLLATKTIEVADPSYVWRIPQVSILDDSQAVIVFLGCGIEEIDTAVTTFGFGA